MATIRRYFGVIGLFAAALLAPHAAHAVTCMNDTDCPDTECGGQVCDWSTMPQTCKPAGTYPQGQDGWCTTSANCKCQSEGATCISVQCSRTLPKSAGNGTGGSAGAGGGSAAAGTASGGTSAAGSAAAGTTSSSSSDSSGSSGCSVGGGMPHGSLGLALGAVCAAALIGARRRRRAA